MITETDLENVEDSLSVTSVRIVVLRQYNNYVDAIKRLEAHNTIFTFYRVATIVLHHSIY